MWEDNANINGGRFVIRTKRGFANKLWEDLLVAYMVDGLEDVCGVIAHTKKTYIQISVWVKELAKGSEEYKNI